MPMTWDAAADAKSFTVVMAVYDIKISGPRNERIAKLMGDDVTAKAITHRLSKIKAHASALDPSTPSSSRKRNTPATKPSSSKTPTTKGKGSNGKHLSATHTITTLMHDTGSDDEEDFSGTPSKTSKSSISANTNFSSKKRKLGKAPKIEDADEAGFFPGMGGDEEYNGDAIDFSVGYKSNTTNIKVEHQGNNNSDEGGMIDLTAEEDADGGAEKDANAANVKDKEKQYLPVIKKEFIEVEDMVSADDDEMAI